MVSGEWNMYGTLVLDLTRIWSMASKRLVFCPFSKIASLYLASIQLDQYGNRLIEQECQGYCQNWSGTILRFSDGKLSSPVTFFSFKFFKQFLDFFGATTFKRESLLCRDKISFCNRLSAVGMSLAKSWPMFAKWQLKTSAISDTVQIFIFPISISAITFSTCWRELGSLISCLPNFPGRGPFLLGARFSLMYLLLEYLSGLLISFNAAHSIY